MTGKQRRLQYEWEKLQQLAQQRSDIVLTATRKDELGIPTAYRIVFLIHSICGIQPKTEEPVFADHFTMELTLPADYPQVDAPPQFQFVGDTLPWHPNIRYHGDIAGHVCINQLNTFTDLAWGVERIALYLRYELYHALPEPPYPEDLNVAAWVRKVGEPCKYIFFNQPKR